jgi:hypothetical protein
MYGFRTVISVARPFYAGDPIGVDLDQSLYALAFSWSILWSTKPNEDSTNKVA